MEIRIRVEETMHQATLYKQKQRSLRVKEIQMVRKLKDGILYDWEDEAKYTTLTVEMVRRSLDKAARYNYHLMEETLENARLLAELFSTPKEGLTEADMELLNEFL